MTVIGTHVHQPSEVERLWVNFSKRLVSGEVLNSATVTAIKRSDDTDATSTLIDSSGYTDNRVYFYVKAGTDGETYKITVKATTDGGQTLEDEVNVVVKET